jgi:hypothetical protein
LADLDDWREEKEEGEEKSRINSLGDICARIDNAQASPVMTPFQIKSRYSLFPNLLN